MLRGNRELETGWGQSGLEEMLASTRISCQSLKKLSLSSGHLKLLDEQGVVNAVPLPSSSLSADPEGSDQKFL